jgi:transcriptional regulator with PAS, ATPase and Fis domain
MIEELQQLVASSELLKFYREADHLLGTSPSKNNLTRLRRCGRIVTESLGKSGSVESSSIGGSLEQEILHFEAQLIKRALDQANGSITRAARSLGITHQGLAFIIDNRHNKTLGRARNPKRIRRRSLTTRQ